MRLFQQPLASVAALSRALFGTDGAFALVRASIRSRYQREYSDYGDSFNKNKLEQCHEHQPCHCAHAAVSLPSRCLLFDVKCSTAVFVQHHQTHMTCFRRNVLISLCLLVSPIIVLLSRSAPLVCSAAVQSTVIMRPEHKRLCRWAIMLLIEWNANFVCVKVIVNNRLNDKNWNRKQTNE